MVIEVSRSGVGDNRGDKREEGEEDEWAVAKNEAVGGRMVVIEVAESGVGDSRGDGREEGEEDEWVTAKNKVVGGRMGV
ncbi:unnamed protein product [Camellia sinensis]